MSVVEWKMRLKKYLSKKLEVSEKLLHLCTVKEILNQIQRTFIISNVGNSHERLCLTAVRGLVCI